jgi:hypothetical protein
MTSYSRLTLVGLVALILGVFISGCSGPSRRERRDAEFAKEAGQTAMSAQDTYFDGNLFVEVNLGRGFGRAGQRSQYAMRHDPSDDSEEAEREYRETRYARPESPLPPVALRLRLTNRGKETIEVEFTECRSELGDFAVRPVKIALAAGQTAEPDPMTSRLGVGSVEIPLSLGLKIRDKVEKKELVLRPIKTETSKP